MFERFTDSARRVVVHAQEESRALGHGKIGAEHLLLGLAHEDSGPAAAALGSLGLTLAGLREAVAAAVEDGGPPPRAHIPFTLRAKRVLEHSLTGARQLQHPYIGSGHLLLGLLAEDDGVAAEILGRAGGTAEIRARALDAIAAMPESPPSPPMPSPSRPTIAQANAAARGLAVALDAARLAKDAAIEAGDLAGARVALEREKAVTEQRLRLAADLAADGEPPPPRESWGSPSAIGRANKKARAMDPAILEARLAKDAALDRGNFAQAKAMRDREKALRAEQLRLVANLMGRQPPASPEPPR